MLGKDNSVSIESLRADAEMESQFKTSYRGYDKKSVNEYIRTLKRETELEIEKLKDAVHDAECERDDMKNSYLSWQQEIKLVKIQKKKAGFFLRKLSIIVLYRSKNLRTIQKTAPFGTVVLSNFKVQFFYSPKIHHAAKHFFIIIK